jgi:hypothetical protein
VAFSTRSVWSRPLMRPVIVVAVIRLPQVP